MEFLLIPVIFAVASAVVAKGKDRSQILWFFIGLVLMPFALLLIAVVKPGPGADQGYH
jgi:hypothetical protein